MLGANTELDKVKSPKATLSLDTEDALADAKNLQKEAEKPAEKVVSLIYPKPSHDEYEDKPSSSPSPTPTPAPQTTPQPESTPSPGTMVVPASIDPTALRQQIIDAGSSIDDIQIQVDADNEQSRADANRLKTYIEGLNPKMTVTVVTNTPGYASGADRITRKHTAVVDEEGAEAIIRKDNTVEMGTDGGARVTVVNPGDQVIPADETEKMFSRSGKAKVVPRFAGGSPGSIYWDVPSSSSKNTASSKKNTKKSINWKKYVENLYDWIPTFFDRVNSWIDSLTRNIERAVGYIKQNQTVDELLSAQQTKMDALTESYARYMETAEQIRKKTKLSSDIIGKIQNGTIDIASYGKTTQTKIKEYQEWYEKALDVAEELEEVKDAQIELSHQKLDNIIDQYENMASAIEKAKEKAQAAIDLKIASGIEVKASDYAPLVEAQTNTIKTLQEELSVLSAEFAKQISEGTLVIGSEAWYEYSNQIQELDTSIIEATTDLRELNDAVNEIVVTNLGYELTALQHMQTVIQQTLDLIEAQGRTATADSYQALIDNGMDQIENLERQNDALRAQQSNLDEMSEKYQELQDQINGNLDSINEIKVSQEQWNDAILDLKIAEIQKYRDELEKTNDTYQRQVDLQQAQEDLDRVRTQRKARIYIEGQGFVQQASVQDVQEKTRALEEKQHDETIAKLDDLIEAVEDSKAENNVYEDVGVSPNDYKVVDLAEMFGVTQDAIDWFRAAFESTNYGGTLPTPISSTSADTGYIGTSSQSVGPITIQEINVTESSDANAVVKEIADKFHVAIIQELYRK